jgi:Carboxypeptidase regulatory-like domain
MKKRKKRIGTSLLLLVATLLPGAAAAKKKPEPDTYAMISGSVFQESGYALPEAAITLIAEPASGSTAAKAQKLEAVSDARGEFIVRVPPGPANYTIVVAAKGYQIMRKSVMVEGQERVEVTFQLERESK